MQPVSIQAMLFDNDMITCTGSVMGHFAALVDDGKSICLFRRTEI